MATVLFDFSVPAAVGDWHAIDDRVMGGISQSQLRYVPEGHAVFEGVVSLERGGGFASVRTTPGDRGLSGATTCLIEVRGDNKQYKLSLITDDAFDGVNYQASFALAAAGWQTVHLPLAAFRANSRGRDVPGAPPLDPARIRQLGLVIGAGQSGSFTLDIRRISLL